MSEPTDNRPRFGYCSNLDSDPQTIYERRTLRDLEKEQYVAVIPLPNSSSLNRKKIRDFVKTLHAKP